MEGERERMREKRGEKGKRRWKGKVDVGLRKEEEERGKRGLERCEAKVEQEYKGKYGRKESWNKKGC